MGLTSHHAQSHCFLNPAHTVRARNKKSPKLHWQNVNGNRLAVQQIQPSVSNWSALDPSSKPVYLVIHTQKVKIPKEICRTVVLSFVLLQNPQQ